MILQKIIEPVFPIIKVGVLFTDKGEIDVLFCCHGNEFCSESVTIIKRRYPDGSVSWFEEVLF